MNFTRGYLIALMVVAVYALAALKANGQGIDPSAQISAQIDANNIDTLTSGLTSNSSTTEPENQAREGHLGGPIEGNVPYFAPLKGGPAGEDFPNSGYVDKTPDWNGGVFLIEQFNDKNSFIGKGDTDTFSTQLGWSFKTPIGTVIQPYISYQWASTGYGGQGSNHADGYGFSLNMQQKIIPLGAITDKQPGAVANIGDTTKDPRCKDNPATIPDHFPNFDMLALLNVSYLDNNLSTLKGNWTYDTQEAYVITPGLEFDIFPKKSSAVGCPIVPSAINVIANYADSMISGHNGESSSAGIASLSERNTYFFILHPRDDCDHTPLRSLSLIESNTIFHDTNQEPFPTSTTPIAYQNWARFGVALQYSDIVNKVQDDPLATKGCGFAAPVVKLEYDYDAFNNQYQAHTVVLTMNFTF